ncbi:MAG: 1-acyl-sn-glycerol-3-phosphate acyltransferase [Proteobacteria bacterium]|nr:1-acyl-sn-glycerol-3-phosphate acyltransferase [Pseudomonadota bacterium]
MDTIFFYLKLLAVLVWTFLTSIIFLFVALISKQRSSVFAKTVNFLALGIFPILGIKLNIEGEENLSVCHPCIFIGNHQSALDVAIYGAMCPPNTVAIGKKEIAYIPLFGWLFKFSGGVMIDRKNKRKAISQIDEAVDAVKNKHLAIGILPEGTRNRSGKGMLPFKKGAFHLAIAAQVPLVPIIISEFGDLVSFENKILRKGTINIRVLPPISTQGKTETDVNELTQQTYELMIGHLNEIRSSFT